jgi:hypothetical protein
MAYEDTSTDVASKSSDSISDDGKLYKKLNDFWTYSLDHPTWIDYRKDAVKCNEYNEGKQWTDEELQTLEDRHQPPTVSNLVSVTVNKLVGELVDQRVRIGFRGRNAEPDGASAQLLSDLFLHIRQANDLEFEEREMAKDGFVSGFGVIEAYPTFDDLYQPEIKVRSEDSLSVFPDPDGRRYDWNEDCKFVSRARWMDAEEAGEKYPKSKASFEELLGNSSVGVVAGGQIADVEQFRNENYVDKKRKRIRLIEVQYKKYERECIYLFSDGTVVKKDERSGELLKKADTAGIAYEQLDRVKAKICCGLIAGGTLIDHKVTPRKYFSLVPYFVYRKKNGAPYSLITLALSVQDAINKRESKSMHLMSTNQTVIERGAIKDKDVYAEELAKPDGVAVVEDGAISQERMLLRNNLDLAAGQQQMYATAINTFFSITGINPNTYAQTGEIRSGSGLKTKFAEANKPIAAIFDNLKRTRKILGRVLLDLIQNYYTAEKILLVTDSPQANPRMVTVSSSQMEKVKQMNYDVVVDDFEDVSTVQQEQWALFMQYLPQILPFGPFWTKKVISMSDLRDKDQLVKELDAQGKPPPVSPRLSFQANLQDLMPEERAFMYEIMGNNELAQFVRQAQPPSAVTTRATVDLAKSKIQAEAKGSPSE